MISGHVPAWKRVGLTLKDQSLVVNSVPVNAILPVTSQKRSWKVKDDKAPEAKRRKKCSAHSRITEVPDYPAGPSSKSTGDSTERSDFAKVGSTAYKIPSTSKVALFSTN